jgi:hypothetical protein
MDVLASDMYRLTADKLQQLCLKRGIDSSGTKGITPMIVRKNQGLQDADVPR